MRKKIYVQSFPGKAGAILQDKEIENYGYAEYAVEDNLYAPFYHELDWKVAKWAKLRGPGSTAVSELFSIPGVSFNLILMLYINLILL